MDYQHADSSQASCRCRVVTDDDLQSSLTAAVWELQRSGKSSDFAQTFRNTGAWGRQPEITPNTSELVERVLYPMSSSSMPYLRFSMRMAAGPTTSKP